MSRILWVDDDFAMIRGLIRPLEKEGHCVDCVCSIKAALEHLKDNDYELILLDLLLPIQGVSIDTSLPASIRSSVESGMLPGEGLLAYIREELDLHTPVGILSVKAEDADVRKRLEKYGISFTLLKGTLFPANLKDTVEHVLGGIDFEGAVKLNLRSKRREVRQVGLEQASGMRLTLELQSVLVELARAEDDRDLRDRAIQILTNSGWSSAAVSANPSLKTKCDIGIVIALAEEFDELFPQVKPLAEHKPEIDQWFYVFKALTNRFATYSCVATFVGDAGGTKSAIIADRLMQEYSPSALVNVGIAGSIDPDVLLGDVIIAEQVDGYLHNAKAVAGKDGRPFDFELSGDPYKMHHEFVTFARHMRFTQQAHAQSWSERCTQRFEGDLDETCRNGLIRKRLVNSPAKLHIGNIASGDVVGASKEFKDWLRNRDRKYLALEMEAGGIVSAAFTRSIPVLVTRSISDFCDTRKKQLDRTSKGAIRRYSLHNALDLLFVFLQLEVLGEPKRHEV